MSPAGGWVLPALLVAALLGCGEETTAEAPVNVYWVGTATGLTRLVAARDTWNAACGRTVINVFGGHDQIELHEVAGEPTARDLSLYSSDSRGPVHIIPRDADMIRVVGDLLGKTNSETCE